MQTATISSINTAYSTAVGPVLFVRRNVLDKIEHEKCLANTPRWLVH